MKWRIYALCSLFVLCLVVLQGVFKGDKDGYEQQHARVGRKCAVTFVSAYFRFPSKHSYGEYESWINNLVMMDMCLVIYTDMPMMSIMSRFSGENKVVKRAILAEEASKGLNRTRGFWEHELMIDPERDIHKSYRLYWVWNLKPIFLDEIRKENPFGSDYFFWIDAGCIRSRDRSLLDFHWSSMEIRPSVSLKHSKQMLVTMIDDFRVGEGADTSFERVDRIAGTVFGGSSYAVREWRKAYMKMFDAYVAEGRFVGKDQSIMATTCLRFKRLCHLIKPSTFYGNPWTYVLLFIQDVPRWEQFLTYYKRY